MRQHRRAIVVLLCSPCILQVADPRLHKIFLRQDVLALRLVHLLSRELCSGRILLYNNLGVQYTWMIDVTYETHEQSLYFVLEIHLVVVLLASIVLWMCHHQKYLGSCILI